MNNNSDKARELMVELISALPGYTPLEIPKEATDTEMRFALALMYKEKAFRSYMIRAIRLNLEGFQQVVDERGLWVQQGRLLVIKELLALTKQMYTESTKIDRIVEEKEVKL